MAVAEPYPSVSQGVFSGRMRLVGFVNKADCLQNVFDIMLRTFFICVRVLIGKRGDIHENHEAYRAGQTRTANVLHQQQLGEEATHGSANERVRLRFGTLSKFMR